MTDPYRPIDCSLHDRLEAAATLRRAHRLRYLDEHDAEREAHDRIADVFARDGAEWLRTAGGLELRLDRVLSLDDVAFRPDGRC